MSTADATPSTEPVLIEIKVKDVQVEFYVTSAEAVPEASFIVTEILVENCYFKHGIDIKAGATVIDVGANVGLFGVKALSLVPGGDITYIGVEPCPPTFKALNHNLLGSGSSASGDSFFHLNDAFSEVVQPAAAARSSAAYPGNIQLFNIALSREPGMLPITYFKYMPGNSTLRPAEKQGLQGGMVPDMMQTAQTFEVTVKTLDQLLADAGTAGRAIDLVKVDVEGEELNVLLGLSSENWARVRQVVLEVHDCLPGEFDSTPGTEAEAEAAASSSTAEDIAQRVAAAAAMAEGSEDTLSAAARAALASATAPNLPGPRGADMDGEWISFVAEEARSFEATGKMVKMVPPPPRNEGRVMQVARLLKGLGFRVVIECSLMLKGAALNYNVYGRKAEA